jgi:2-haloacid dehalogenase
MKPAVVLFDVFGTMFRLDPLGAKLEEIGLPGALKVWFARTLRDAFALEAAGAFKTFREVASGALEVLLVENGRDPDRKAIRGVLDTFKELPAWADVKPSLERLRERGVRIATLGNGSSEVAKALLEHAGISSFFEATLSVEEAKHWKPDPAAYQFALRKLDVQAKDAALIAAHAWDVMGARRAGLRGAYVSRLEKRFQPAMEQPSLTGESIDEVIEKLL